MTRLLFRVVPHLRERDPEPLAVLRAMESEVGGAVDRVACGPCATDLLTPAGAAARWRPPPRYLCTIT